MRKILNWVVPGLPTLLLIGSAIAKITGNIPKDQPTPHLNPDYMLPIGLIELICALLYIYPKTSQLGFYLLCSYLGGAIVAHLFIQTGVIFPVIILIVVWIGMYIRKPSLFSPLPQLL